MRDLPSLRSAPSRAATATATTLAALVGLATLGVSGCSHEAGAGTTAAAIARVPELPLESLVDPGARGAVHVDVGMLTSAPAYRSALEWIDVATEDADDHDTAMVRTVLRAREAIMFLAERGPDNAPAAVALMRGDFTMDDALAFQRRDGQSDERIVGGFRVRDLGTESSVVLFGTHTLVVGDRLLLDAVVDRQIQGGHGSYPRDDAFRTLAEQVSFSASPVGFVVVPSEAMRREASRESDPLAQALASAQGIGVGLDLRNGLRGRAVVRLESSLVAMGLVTIGRARLASLLEETDVAETGLVPLLSRVVLSREGSSVVVDLEAPEDQTVRSFDAFGQFLRGTQRPR